MNKDKLKHLIRQDFIEDLEAEFSRNTAKFQEDFRRFLKADNLRCWEIDSIWKNLDPIVVNPIDRFIRRHGAISFPEVSNSLACYLNANGGQGYNGRSVKYNYVAKNQKLKSLLGDKGVVSTQISKLYNSWYEKITLLEGIKHQNGMFIRDWKKENEPDAISRAINYMKEELATSVNEIPQKLPEEIRYLHDFNHDGIEISLPEYAVDDFRNTPYAAITNLLPNLCSIIAAVESVVVQRKRLTKEPDEIIPGKYNGRNMNVQLRYIQEDRAVVSQISLLA